MRSSTHPRVTQSNDLLVVLLGGLLVAHSHVFGRVRTNRGRLGRLGLLDDWRPREDSRAALGRER